jgi:RNA polymerase sigma-70 factor, ECF subfamily
VEPGTDADLIRRSRDEPGLFEVIFDRHYDMVRVYAQRRVGMDDGEEIAAGTFELAFTQRNRFDADTFRSARPWLVGIANNLIRRHARHEDVRRRRWPLSIAIDRSGLEPSLERLIDGLAALERGPAIRSALAALSDGDRETFLLVVLAELSYEDVAQIVGVPTGTVRSRINRVRRQLRELLGAAEAINPGGQDQGSSP